MRFFLVFIRIKSLSHIETCLFMPDKHFHIYTYPAIKIKYIKPKCQSIGKI